MTKLLEPSLLTKVQPPAETIASVVSEFEGRTQSKAAPIRKGWKGLLGCKTDGHLFLGIQTQSKPPKQVLALIVANSNMVMFPTESEDDFRATSKVMRLVSDEQLVRLYEFCNLEYGLIEKSEPAVLLNDSSAFEKAGLAVEGIDEMVAGSRTLWWQCWGGKLYEADSSGQGIKIIRTRCGKLKRLPYWVIR